MITSSTDESSRNRIVIYHGPDCADGFTAAWVAWLKFGDAAEYIPTNYGDEPPDVRGKNVIIVDFSYPRAVLERMCDEGHSLRVLDHHKTAAADLAGLPYATFDMARSGAGLTWDELHGGKRPELVNYVEDRDLWKWALPHSKEINAYIGAMEKRFAVWQGVSDAFALGLHSMIVQGNAILSAQNRYVESKLRHARLLVVHGVVVPVINTTHAASELIGELAQSYHFAVGWWQDERGIYRYGLRSRGAFDVSAIAKLYPGGGGHHNAAGFEWPLGPDQLWSKP